MAGVSPVVAVAGLRTAKEELDFALRRLRDLIIQMARIVAISVREQVLLFLHGRNSTAVAPAIQANLPTIVANTAASFLLAIF
jgi:hypothetical protein